MIPKRYFIIFLVVYLGVMTTLYLSLIFPQRLKIGRLKEETINRRTFAPKEDLFENKEEAKIITSSFSKTLFSRKDSILPYLTILFRETELNLLSIIPLPLEKKNQFTKISYKVSFLSDYRNMVRFFDLLERGKFFFSVPELLVKGSSPNMEKTEITLVTYIKSG